MYVPLQKVMTELAPAVQFAAPWCVQCTHCVMHNTTSCARQYSTGLAHVSNLGVINTNSRAQEAAVHQAFS